MLLVYDEQVTWCSWCEDLPNLLFRFVFDRSCAFSPLFHGIFFLTFFFLVSFLWFAGRWLQECRKDRFEWTRFRKIRARESSRGRPFSLPRRWHPRSRSYFASFASVPSHRIPVRGQHSSQLAVRAMVFANFATIASLNDPINDLVIHPVIKTLLHIWNRSNRTVDYFDSKIEHRQTCHDLMRIFLLPTFMSNSNLDFAINWNWSTPSKLWNPWKIWKFVHMQLGTHVIVPIFPKCKSNHTQTRVNQRKPYKITNLTSFESSKHL